MNNLVQNKNSQFGSFQAAWCHWRRETLNFWAIWRLGLSPLAVSISS